MQADGEIIIVEKFLLAKISDSDYIIDLQLSNFLILIYFTPLSSFLQGCVSREHVRRGLLGAGKIARPRSEIVYS